MGPTELGYQMYIKWLVLASGLESSPLRMKGRKGVWEGGRKGGREEVGQGGTLLRALCLDFKADL